jgi:hypothetical protein
LKAVEVSGKSLEGREDRKLASLSVCRIKDSTAFELSSLIAFQHASKVRLAMSHEQNL